MLWLDKVLDRFFVVAGAFIFCQIPEFFQQYIQRLSGHVEELKRLVAQIQQAAAFSGKALPQYIEKFLSNSDQDFMSQGMLMQQVVQRFNELQETLTAMQEASVFSRPFVFFTHFQKDIAIGTLSSFKPALALTYEGFFYALVGLFAGYCLYILLKNVYWLSIRIIRFPFTNTR